MSDLTLLSIDNPSRAVSYIKSIMCPLFSGRYPFSFKQYKAVLNDVQFKCNHIKLHIVQQNNFYLQNTLDFVLKNVKGYIVFDKAIENMRIDVNRYSNSAVVATGKIIQTACLVKIFEILTNMLSKDFNRSEIAFVGEIDVYCTNLIEILAHKCNFLTIITDDLVSAYNIREKMVQKHGLSLGIIKNPNKIMKDLDIIICNNSNIKINSNNIKRDAIIYCLNGFVDIDAYVHRRAIIFNDIYITNDNLQIPDVVYDNKRYSYEFIEGIIFYNDNNNIKHTFSPKNINEIWRCIDKYKFEIKGLLYKNVFIPLAQIERNYIS